MKRRSGNLSPPHWMSEPFLTLTKRMNEEKSLRSAFGTLLSICNKEKKNRTLKSIAITASILSDHHQVCQSSMMRKDLKIKMYFSNWFQLFWNSSAMYYLLANIKYPLSQVCCWKLRVSRCTKYQLTVFTSVHCASQLWGTHGLLNVCPCFQYLLARLSISVHVCVVSTCLAPAPTGYA